MGTTRVAAVQDDVQAEIARRTAELAENVRRAKAAACSIPGPMPGEGDLVRLLGELSDVEQRRQLHVALVAMRDLWEQQKRLEAKGVPWVVVFFEALRDIAGRFLAARQRGETLTPDEELQYVTVARLLAEVQPEWEAFCALERRKATFAQEVRTAERLPLTKQAHRNRRDAEAGDEEILPALVERVLCGDRNKEIKDELGISEQRVKRIRARAVREGKLPPRGKGLRASPRE